MPTEINDELIKALTEALTPVITTVASKAAADHVTKRNEALDKKLDGRFDEVLSKFAPKQEEPEKPETATIKSLEAKFKRMETERQAERDAMNAKLMRSSLIQELTEGEVPSHLIKAAVAQLIHEDRLVSVDKEGNPVFRSLDDEFVPLKEGVQNWLQNEGKTLVAPAQKRGAEQRTFQRKTPSPLNGFQSVEDRDSALDVLIRSKR